MEARKEISRVDRVGMLFLYGILGAIFLTAFCALCGVFALCVCCL